MSQQCQVLGEHNRNEFEACENWAVGIVIKSSKFKATNQVILWLNPSRILTAFSRIQTDWFLIIFQECWNLSLGHLLLPSSCVAQQLSLACLAEEGGGLGKQVSPHSVLRPFNDMMGWFWMIFSALFRAKHQKSILTFCRVTEYGDCEVVWMERFLLLLEKHTYEDMVAEITS